MTADTPPPEHPIPALDQQIIDAIDALQTDSILTPEMQERVRGRLMQRIAQDHTPRPGNCVPLRRIPK